MWSGIVHHKSDRKSCVLPIADRNIYDYAYRLVLDIGATFDLASCIMSSTLNILNMTFSIGQCMYRALDPREVSYHSHVSSHNSPSKLRFSILARSMRTDSQSVYHRVRKINQTWEQAFPWWTGRFDSVLVKPTAQITSVTLPAKSSVCLDGWDFRNPTF